MGPRALPPILLNVAYLEVGQLLSLDHPVKTGDRTDTEGTTENNLEAQDRKSGK